MESYFVSRKKDERQSLDDIRDGRFKIRPYQIPSLQVLGLWPKAEQIHREKLICNIRVFVISLLMIIGLLFPCTHSLMRFREDMTLIFEHLQFILPTTSCIVRIVIFWWKKEAIIPIINMMTEDWLETRNVQEKDTMIKWAQRARTIIIVAYFIMGVTYFCVTFLPIFGISTTYVTNATDKLLPLPTYYIYDVTKRPYYELTYISHGIVTFFAGISYTGIDSFLGLLVFHICGQLSILKTRLVYLDEVMTFHDNIKRCVIRHIRLLRAIAIIEDIYNIILLALFLYFGIFFAFSVFSLISLIEEKDNVSISRATFLISIIVNMFVHMGLYCAVGEILTTQCDRLYYAVSNQKWYNHTPKNAKHLILLMIRSAKAPYITAGKVFPITMATFSNLVKTSAGYISVLLTTKNT